MLSQNVATITSGVNGSSTAASASGAGPTEKTYRSFRNEIEINYRRLQRRSNQTVDE